VSDPISLPDIDSVLVTTRDGVALHVSPVLFGGPNSPYPPSVRLRWRIVRLSARAQGDEGPMEWVGPAIGPSAEHRSVAGVQAMIEEWWVGARKD
jgi:hypothetical protein